jgi:hypothetical protein
MCGEVSPTRFRFCGYCGTAFPDALPAMEVRKTATILFCDLKGFVRRSRDMAGRSTSSSATR